MDVELDYCDRAAAGLLRSWNVRSRLISLWELLNTKLQSLRITRHVAYLEALQGNLSQLSGDIDEGSWKNAVTSATELAELCGDLKLKVSESSVHSLLEGLRNTIKAPRLATLMHNAVLTLVRETDSVKFLPATPDMEKYLDSPLPFGKSVADSFPECSEDICEAHECFAFGRYTAAMFHLGRAMEIAVKRLAARMRVKKPARDEWQHYINAMNEKINKMPFKTAKQKARRAIFSEATNYLFNFKEAWRNPTVHPKKTYTRSEALTVLEGAGAYLRHVSHKLFKKHS
jgi:HEPN domain-containing protein